jgi:hypothetical protein
MATATSAAVMEATDMRAWILVGSLAAALGATACGTQAASPFGATGQAMVQCEPGQHAVVNQSAIDGRTITSVNCATDAPLAYQPRAAYQEPIYQPAPPVRPRPAVIRSEEPSAAPATQVVAERKPARSWQKRAMVIGGSSGAGAGLGAIIGGKKGALIGAAIGGGAGTIYETQK